MHGVENMETLKRKVPFMSRFNSKFRTDINKYFTPCIRNLWHSHGMVMVIGFDKSVMGIDSFTPVKSIRGSCPGGHLCDQRLHDFVCQLAAGADNSVYVCVCVIFMPCCGLLGISSSSCDTRRWINWISISDPARLLLYF